MKFRHEWKHELLQGQLLALRSRLSAVMEIDEHAINGSYEIRSLYFDNFRDKALLEKINGINHRKKFRLRYYNGDLTRIMLEKKTKWNGLCNKKQEEISVEEVRWILDGSLPEKQPMNKPLLQELRQKMMEQGLKPKTIVDYVREPFVYPAGNTRVTLDYDIRTGLASTDFLNPTSVTIPAGEATGILEVKWDEFLPAVIRDLVQITGTHTVAFSKYATCRIYG